jgi:hypothetical protein
MAGGLIVLTLIQLVSYQNCGSDFVVKDGLNLASSASTCEASLEADFQSSYYAFLKTNCATCHTSRGPGNGAFADSNPDLAFSAFLLTGSDRIDVNATNSAHAGGYTGAQNTSAIDLASQQWGAAEAQCKAGGGGVGSGFITVGKAMNATATAHDVTWNLDSELASGSGSTGGATLTVAVRETASANGTPVYYFSNPRLKGGSSSVSVEGLMVRINGQEQTLGSTWSRVSATANAGQSVPLSAAQMIIEYPAFTSSDTLSLSIDSITAP